MDRVGSLSRPLRSFVLLFPMFHLRCVWNIPSGEPVTPTAEFIIVVSNVPASQCFCNGPSGELVTPTAEFIIVVSNVPASLCLEWIEWGACLADCGVYYCCFQCCSFTVFGMDRVVSLSR